MSFVPSRGAGCKAELATNDCDAASLFLSEHDELQRTAERSKTFLICIYLPSVGGGCATPHAWTASAFGRVLSTTSLAVVGSTLSTLSEESNTLH